ncbi:hypothetical protein WOLCODRAFT_137925 [Wolfiporia cocos MD-104 SS10]|uniref:BHLH domain-containing protein n=1 Tax=Wolfiporia cocos (strain MD-104) TaxID=742152 RepID=A0A2H3JJX6_WOLCO|nr:hypothetical protein WOLCODRAFT_137925 [Wolfiporia cocos MD-104 SS10]
MSLLSRQDSLAYGSFLTSVDRTAGADDIDPSIAAQIDIAHGRDALAKATKDLMSIGSTAPAAHAARPATQARSVAGMNAGGSTGLWPGFAPEQYSAAAAERHARPVETRAQSRVREHPQQPQSTRARGGQAHPQSQPQIPPIRDIAPSAAAPFSLPPLSEHLSTQGAGIPQRSPLASSTSAPSLLMHPPTGAKRTLLDAESSTPDGSTPKRARPTLSLADPPPVKPTRRSTIANVNTASNSGASMSTPKTPGAPAPKPALLSPSQKRANHIQSEQKRRANIRRGYEALCVAVPELREAIAREESSGVGRSGSTDGTEPGVKGKRRRKKADEPSGLDGRAGPRSENIVLQKTIDYIHSLLSQHQGLLVRLQVARNTLLHQGNPPFPVPPQYLDANGVPLWDREWNGGTGINEDEEEEGGSEDDG